MIRTSAAIAIVVVTISLMAVPPVAAAETAPAYPKARVDFADFKQLVEVVEQHRKSRLVSLDRFLEMSRQPGVLILDARSADRYARIHLKGAKHLAFTDFTQENLKRLIPSPETIVLIYCNNNFEGNPVDFATKAALPPPPARANTQLAGQAKPIMLALNIPTYINLYGYGYRNVYELDEWVNVRDPRITFEGSTIAPGLGTPQPQPARRSGG